VPKEAPPAAGVNTQKEPASSADENLNPPPKETVMEDAIRLTRGRLRKNRSSVKS